jgi:SAM-dependent methyltransferase
MTRQYNFGGLLGLWGAGVNSDLYDQRALVEGYPGLQQMGAAYFAEREGSIMAADIGETISCLDRLIRPSPCSCRVAVVGCGPSPSVVRGFLEHGFDAIGIEPIEEFVSLAQSSLGVEDRIFQGCAEEMPLEDGSCNVVLMEKVIEHVDSIEKSLAEAFRVLAPGGVLYVQTISRWKFSPLGWNDEFRIPFFNWYPATVKECYVFSHLHYKPRLANYTVRPAVHWLNYADLCRYGREAGFAQFYSFLDVLPSESPRLRKSLVRRVMYWLAKRNNWIKALALTQFGGTVFMWKRPVSGRRTNPTRTGREAVSVPQEPDQRIDGIVANASVVPT